MGWIAEAKPVIFQIYSEPLQKFRLAAQGHGPLQPPDAHRARIATYFDPLPIWYAPFGGDAGRRGGVPAARPDPTADGDVPVVGSQNAWLRQIHGWNRLYMNRAAAARQGLADGDWVWIESHNGRVKAQIGLMEGCNADTVWTWNAIGKRRGAWNLADDAHEATKGFLLNHLIAELLPPKDGLRYANADPITGQAAWFDLRVRLVKAAPAEAGMSAPQFPATARVPGIAPAPAILRYGERFRRRAGP